MSLRDSESDVGGRLGASLTPRVPGAHVQEPGEQNSGLVDIRALYAASVDHVVQRAQAARARPPVVAFDPVAIDDEPVVLPRQRMGRLPVTGMLLVLATAGGLFVAYSDAPVAVHARATVAPAVVHAKTTLAPVVMRATTTMVDVAIRAEAGVVARLDRLTGRPVPVAAPVAVQPSEAPPVAPAALPVAPAPALSPPASQVAEAAAPGAVVSARTAPVPAPPARAPVTHAHALPKAAVEIRPMTRAPRHPGSTNPPGTTATPTNASAAEDEAREPAAVKAAPEPAKAAVPAPGGADSKPMSLDDMIRRAVEAESKHKQ